MTASRDRPSGPEKGTEPPPRSIRGAKPRGRVVVESTGNTVSSVPPEVSSRNVPAPTHDDPAGQGEPAEHAVLGSADAADLRAPAEGGSRSSSAPPGQLSARAGQGPSGQAGLKPRLKGTGYSEIPSPRNREERVSPESIPPAPQVPSIETSAGPPEAEKFRSAAASAPSGGAASRGADGAVPEGTRSIGRAVLGATLLKRGGVVAGSEAVRAPGGSSTTLASAPDGARTLFGGAAAQERKPSERAFGGAARGTGSSAPPPVPNIGGEGDVEVSAAPGLGGDAMPRAPRTLESLRAVTTDSSPAAAGELRRELLGRTFQGGSFSAGAFNKTLTGASYLPQRVSPGRGGEPTASQQSAPHSERTLTGLPAEDPPPTPMRPAGAMVVGSLNSSNFSGRPEYAPPSSDELAVAISEAAQGQLRESELPVPSERLDAEVLRQLGKLDEALRSSPRVPTFVRPPSSRPRFDDEDAIEPSRIPSSALNAPSPGSVPSPSVLPHGLRPQENQSGLPTVGRYEILARLKSGGMGSVYMCRLSGNAGFRRLFAMKVLHAHLASDPEAQASFEREARVLAMLHHPNIVGVVDVGSPSEPYIVLEYVEGGSLHELLRASDGNRDPRLVVSIILEVLEGLRVAHRAQDEEGRLLGLVHCDVCPQNILVGVDGTARLSDFGIAQTTDSIKRGHVVRGKPRYIAPERLDALSFDARADLFSVGGVLYTALTGIEAFTGETTRETRWNVAHRDPAPPSQVGLRPPPAMDWIVMKALSKDPAGRFHSADEFAEQLRRAAEREGLLASRAEIGEWVRQTLAPSLRARKVAAQRGSGGLGRSEVPPAVVPNQELPSRGESTAPISSSRPTSEHTEVLSGVGASPGGTSGSKRNLYLALALIVGVVAWALVAPESLSTLFQVEQETDAGLPREERHDADVVVPEISAPFGSPSSDERVDPDGSEQPDGVEQLDDGEPAGEEQQYVE